MSHGERGLPVRGGRRARSTCWCKRCAGDVPAALRAAQLPRERRDSDGARRTRDRGHGQAPRRRRRSGTRWPRATARSTPWTPPCARPSTAPSPTCDDMHLVDYKVRVINSEAGHGRRRPRGHRKPATSTTSGAPSASARTSSRPAGSPWSTAIEYKLCKDELEPQPEQSARHRQQNRQPASNLPKQQPESVNGYRGR